MTTKTFLHDFGAKIALGVITPLTLGGLYWLQSNIVLAGDLEGVADRIAQQVSTQLSEIARQTEANKLEICTGKRSSLKAYIRDLRVELYEMEAAKQSGEPWSALQEAMLRQWREDLADSERELNRLNC